MLGDETDVLGKWKSVETTALERVPSCFEAFLLFIFLNNLFGYSATFNVDCLVLLGMKLEDSLFGFFRD